MEGRALSTTGIHSGTVMTVLGPIPVDAMGITLMHEHIVIDTAIWWRRPCCATDIGLAERPLDIAMLGELRLNPFLNRDNCGLVDAEVAIEELQRFVEQGGRTVVDPTNLGIGRDPAALQRISRRIGLNTVMSTGFYLEPSHPDYVKHKPIAELAAQLIFDVGGADEKPEVIAGMIGEIGVSAAVTANED